MPARRLQVGALIAVGRRHRHLGAGSRHERFRPGATPDDQSGRPAGVAACPDRAAASATACTWPAKPRESRRIDAGPRHSSGAAKSIESLDNARPEVRNVIERAQRFLRLAALLTVVLAAVAVAWRRDRYMRRHLDGCAVMRCLGASRAATAADPWRRVHPLRTGGDAGWVAHLAMRSQGVLHTLLAGLIANDLPAPSAAALAAWPGWWACVLVVGFVVPPLLRLKSVPTVRVLRREWVRVEPLSIASYLLGMGCLAGLMFWMAGEVRLGTDRAGWISRCDRGVRAGRQLAAEVTGYAVVAIVYGWLAHRLRGPAAPQRCDPGTSRGPGIGLDDLAAADAGEERSAECLASKDAGRCAEPFPDQHPARPAPRHRGLFQAGRCAGTTTRTDGARPPGAA